jgi:hypothetical protein
MLRVSRKTGVGVGTAFGFLNTRGKARDQITIENDEKRTTCHSIRIWP